MVLIQVLASIGLSRPYLKGTSTSLSDKHQPQRYSLRAGVAVLALAAGPHNSDMH